MLIINQLSSKENSSFLKATMIFCSMQKAKQRITFSFSSEFVSYTSIVLFPFKFPSSFQVMLSVHPLHCSYNEIEGLSRKFGRFEFFLLLQKLQ